MKYDFDAMLLNVLERLQDIPNDKFSLSVIKSIFDRRKQQLVNGSIIELFLDTVIAEAKEVLNGKI